MSKYNYLILLLTCLCSVADGARILAVFPFPVRSHFVMTKTIVKTLAARGHVVDLYTSFAEEEKIPGINHHQIPGIELLNTPLSVADLRALTTTGIIELMFVEENNGYDLCTKAFNTDVLQKLKRSKTDYDLLIFEMFTIDCFFGFSHIFKAPFIAFTSSVDLPWGSHRIGNIDNPSFIPTYFGKLDKNMDLPQRILNTLILAYSKYRHYFHISGQQQIAKEFFGDDLPPLNDIVSNTSLMLVNSHFSLNTPRPTVPNFIEVAGLHIREPKTPPQNILDFIGNKKFVYFSFGSIAGSETLPVDKLQGILNALDGFGYKVLWKANGSSLPEALSVPKSVYVEPWMPQLDILCHPNLKFFITHSGLMSTQEAIYCGVPMISVPLFADQYLNAKNIANMRMGLTLNIESVTAEGIKKTIGELSINPMYKKNAKDISRKFKDRPFKPLDEAMFWIEYVIRYGGAPQLRSNSADLSWYQYYLLDVGLILGAILISVLYLSYRLILLTVKYLGRIMNKEKQQ